MSATVITFPTRERPKKPPAQKALSDRPTDTAVGIVLPAEMTVDIGLPDRYFYPRGVTDRCVNMVFKTLMCRPTDDPDRRAYIAAWDRAFCGRREIEAAVYEQHKIFFAEMWRRHPSMARRVVAAMQRGAVMSATERSARPSSPA
jgi:hypothetical protein